MSAALFNNLIAKKMRSYRHTNGEIEPLPGPKDGKMFEIITDENGNPVAITNEHGVRFAIEEPAPPPLTYQQIKKRFALTDADIGAAFGLSELAFRNSSALPRYKAAVELLYAYFLQKQPA